MSQQFAKEVAWDGVRGRGENVFVGFLAGLAAAAVGAAVWMWVTLATESHLGLVAIGVGALVGFAIRLAGNGQGLIYGLMGAVLTLAGCVSGEVLTLVQLSVTPDRDFYHTITTIDLVQLTSNMLSNMTPITYLIYGVGLFEGYKFSMRK